jgi:hypothetical protein
LEDHTPPTIPLDEPRPLNEGGPRSGSPRCAAWQDLSITAEGAAPDGRAVDVILHVIAGRIVELEIWAGTFGGDPRTDLPEPATLNFY